MNKAWFRCLLLVTFVSLILLSAAFPAPPAGGTEPGKPASPRPTGTSGYLIPDDEHYLGCLPSRVDPSSLDFQRSVSASLPPEVDLSADLPPVKSQGRQGSCVGWATTYYYKTWLEKQEHVSWDLADETHQFSPAWTYNQINDGGNDSGSEIHDALTLLSRYGAVDMVEMPYSDRNCSTRPTLEQYEAAKPYRSGPEVRALWCRESIEGPSGFPVPFDPPNDVGPAKTLLASGKIFVIGVPICDDFPDKAGNPPAHYYAYDGVSDLLGGHGMCVVGYDDNANPSGADADHRGGFKVVNSWGPGWNGPDAGFVYFSYDFMKRFCMEAFYSEDRAPDGPRLDAVSAGQANPRALVALSGENFGSRRRGARVSFNGTDAGFSSFTDDCIVAEVPETATSGPVTVYDWEGTATGSLPFTVGGLPGNPVAFDSLSPESTLTGGEFELTAKGVGLTPGCQAYLACGSACLPLKNASVVGGTISGTFDARHAPPGCYRLFAVNPSADGDLIGTLTVFIDNPVDTYEPNNSAAEAAGFLEGRTDYLSFISTRADVDFFQFMVPERARALRLQLSDIPFPCHFVLALYGSNGDKLDESIHLTRDSEEIVWEDPPPGIYYAGVETALNFDPVHPYRLRVEMDVDAPTWYLPEGCTAGGFETWLCLENQGYEDASVGVTYHNGDGQLPGPSLTLPARSRVTVNAADSAGEQWELACVVTADREISVERSTYWDGRAAGHSSAAAADKGKEWYLAEGCTEGGFETWLLVLNPGTMPAGVKITYHTGTGEAAGPSLVVPPESRRSLNLGETAPASWDVSAEVTGDAPVVVERAMYWNGRTAGHSCMGEREPGQEWYMAEGCTAGGFETWVCVANHGDEAAPVEMDFLSRGGTVEGPEFVLEPDSRRTVNVADWLPDAMEVSTLVVSEAPVTAERSCYWNNRTGGHCSPGAGGGAQAWCVAEGCTAGGFETWILVVNPGDEAAVVRLWFLAGGVTVSGPQAVVGAGCRATFAVGETVPDTWSVSTEVTSDAPVVVERATYWGGRREGHSSPGVTP